MKIQDMLGVSLSYLVFELAGLLVGMRLISYFKPVQENSVGFSIWLFVYMLIVTGIIILLIRYVPKFMKVLEIITIFIGTEAFFEITFLGAPNAWIPALILSLLIIYLRLVYPKSIWSINIAMITTALGIGPLLGASLGPSPAWALLGILAIYDYISVFKTKHMVYLAKNVIKENIALATAIPTSVRVMHLGGGDILMPMLVIVSEYSSEGLFPSIMLSIGATVGLFALLWIGFRKRSRVMPALPTITLGMVIFYFAYLGMKLIRW